MNNTIKFKHYRNFDTSRVITVVSQHFPKENLIHIGFSIFNPKDKMWNRKDGNYIAVDRLTKYPIIVEYVDIFDTYNLSRSTVFKGLVIKAVYSYFVFVDYFDTFFEKTSTSLINHFLDCIEKEDSSDLDLYLQQVRKTFSYPIQ